MEELNLLRPRPKNEEKETSENIYKLNILRDGKRSQGHVTIKVKTCEQRFCPLNKRPEAVVQ